MEALSNTLKTIGEKIQKAFVNFKKDSNDRKNDEYFRKKIESLNSLYNQFSDIENELCASDPDHELEYRKSILDSYENYSQILRNGLQSVKQTNNAAHNIMSFVSKSAAHSSPSASSSASANELKTALSKIADLENELSQLKETNKSLQTIIETSENSDLTAATSENLTLKATIKDLEEKLSAMDQLQLTIDSLNSQIQASKRNYDRVVYEKRQIQIKLDNAEFVNSTQFNSNNNHSRYSENSSLSNDELFTIRDIVKLIPKFNGNRSELRIFINKCTELWAYVKEGADQARFITVLKNNLSGEAAMLLLDEDDIEDWESLRDLLNANFNSDPNHSNNIAQMQNMKQSANESVENYCKRIKDILSKLKSSIPNGATKQFWFEHTESHAIQALEDGLRDVNLQSRVIAARKKSFNIASQYAIETDSRLKSKSIDLPSIDQNKKESKILCNYCKKNQSYNR